MTSIGNDIIDLKHSNNNRASDKQFYAKIIHSTEIALYSQTHFSSFEQFVWLLWSIKEAAYKYLKRNEPGLLFAPHKIIIQEFSFSLAPTPKSTDESLFTFTHRDNHALHNCKSNVYFKGITLTGLSLICDRFIHTVVIHPGEEKICHGGIKHIAVTDHEHQSKEVRNFFLKNISHQQPSLNNISVTNHDHGYPLLMENDTDKQVCISFSHHGNYVAYTYLEQ